MCPFVPPINENGHPSEGTNRWELFDLDTDYGEIYGLSKTRPEILRDLLQLWGQYVVETGVGLLNPALGELIAAIEEQVLDDGWIGYEFWKKSTGATPNKFCMICKVK